MSNLIPYDPYSELVEFRRNVNRMFDTLWSASPFDPRDRSYLPVDLIETPDAFVVKASLPGFQEKEVDIDVKGDWLVITAKHEEMNSHKGQRWHVQERQSSQFYREIKLPAEFKGKHVKAELENGVLKVTLPKTTPSPIESIKVAVKKILPRVQRPQINAKVHA